MAVSLLACGGPQAPDAASQVSRDDAGGDAGVEASGDTAGTCPGPFLASSDGRIAAALDAVDRAELVVAQSVRNRLATPGAVAFAEKAVTDHTLLDMQLRGAVRTDHVPILSGSASDAVAAQASQAAQALGPLHGEALDRAYVSHELLVHLQELAMIDRLAAPNVRDVRLAAAVAAARDIAATHLRLAAELQQELEVSP
jgi:predicted outer membrane protein